MPRVSPSLEVLYISSHKEQRDMRQQVSQWDEQILWFDRTLYKKSTILANEIRCSGSKKRVITIVLMRKPQYLQHLPDVCETFIIIIIVFINYEI